MKKRIISLILVVATLVLTLTGCAFNYAKRDLSKYATLSSADIKSILQSLTIKDSDFGTDNAKREEKVNDAVLKALLSADQTKKNSGAVGTNDQFAYCYVAVDADGNVFYSEKMNATNPTVFQLGLTGVEGLNAEVAKRLADLDNIKSYIYNVKSANTVALGDAISVSYLATYDVEVKDENGQTVLDEHGNPKKEQKNETIWHEYKVIVAGDEFSEQLIGAQVGVEYHPVTTDPIAFKDGETTVLKTVSNVKVEHIAYRPTDSKALNVKDEDVVFVSYTVEFDATAFKNEDNTYTFPGEFGNYNYDIKGGKYSATVSYEIRKADEYVLQEGETETPADKKTFENQIIGLTAGSSTTGKFTIKNGEDLGEGNYLELEYKDVKVNYIVSRGDVQSIDVDESKHITFKYTPHTEALNESGSNKVTATNVYGKKVPLNGVELTYYVFPVYYVDVVDTADAEATARFILSHFADVLTAVEPHEHTDNDAHEYIFNVLNDEYKNGDKTALALVEELAELYKTYSEKKKTLDSAAASLKTAQTNLAKADSSATNYSDLQTKLTNAETAYGTAKVDADLAFGKIYAPAVGETPESGKVAEILAAKKDEELIPSAKFFEGYTEYERIVLKLTYEDEIRTKVQTAVIDAYSKCGTFTGELPKSAVKQAYKALMNQYKNNYYGVKTTFDAYADFDSYLIATLKVTTIEEAEAKVQAEAEKTVQDIIRIYILLDAVEEAYNVDLSLTKAEKKEIKKYLKDLSALYKQYGVAYEYDLNTYYHAAQFDKIMEFLLAEGEDTGNAIEYKNISYTAN